MTAISLTEGEIIEGKKTFYEIEFEAWKERAAYYDELFSFVANQAIAPILDSLGDLQGQRHLDIACGTGHLVADAVKRGAISEGIDFAPEMVFAARENYPKNSFRIANAATLPYEEDTFDVVTCSFGLSHLENPQLAIAEAFRVLKADGVLAFTLWNDADNGAELLSICRDGFKQYAIDTSEPANAETPLRYADKSLCNDIVLQAGFHRPAFHTLPIIVQSVKAQVIVDILFRLSVRVRLQLESRPPPIQALIYSYILGVVESHRNVGQIRLDWPALLTISRKPAKMKSRNMMLNQIEAKYKLYDSLDEMLAPTNLSKLLGRKVTTVSYKPFESADSHSGNLLFDVSVDDQRLVMKQLRPSHDWKSVATDDYLCRSVRVWQYGILDRLRPQMDHAVIAACHFSEDYAILMHDVSAGFFYDRELTDEMLFALVDALAEVHAKFWEDATLPSPELGLASIEGLISVNWPQHWDRFSHDPLIVTRLKEGWDALLAELDPDCSQALKKILAEPQPLFNALEKLPHTFIHAGYRPGNVAVMPESDQVIAFDWQEASYGPATVCFSWLLLASEISSNRQVVADYYRQQLFEKLGYHIEPALWQEMVDLGNLAVILRKAVWHAWYFTRSDEPTRTELKQLINSYNTLIRKGIKWL